MAATESLQAIARQSTQLQKERGPNISSDHREEEPVTGPPPPGSQETAPSDQGALSLLQRAVREGHLLLPDGEVLLCRALLHRPLPDNPLGYTSEAASALRERGPTKESLRKAEELHSETVLCHLYLVINHSFDFVLLLKYVRIYLYVSKKQVAMYTDISAWP